LSRDHRSFLSSEDGERAGLVDVEVAIDAMGDDRLPGLEGEALAVQRDLDAVGLEGDEIADRGHVVERRAVGPGGVADAVDVVCSIASTSAASCSRRSAWSPGLGVSVATSSSLLRRLRPSPERFAAAAALNDPSLLLRYEAARAREEQRPTTAPRPRRSLRSAIRGEQGAALLLGAAVALALLWSNSPSSASYFAFWHAPVALTVGPWTLGADLRTWIDEGLMTLFFLVVGLEAKRERDLGELREGGRLTVPVLAGLTGMAASAAIYVALTAGAGGAGAGGWGAAISTHTALALGALTIAGGDRAARLRAFMLTLLVVDDVVALVVISFVYPGQIHVAAVIVAGAQLATLLAIRAIAGRQFRARGTSTAVLTPVSVLIGVALWLSLFESGIDPVVSGLLIGLLTNAYEPRPQGPAAISPNDRIQHRLHPWTSRVVVPIFALANAGLHLDGGVLAAAASSPITWGIVLAYVVGKPLAIVIASAAASRSTSRRAVLRLGRGELRAAALSTAVGFTVSLLMASRAFDGALLDQAKVGILATALLAPALAGAALAPLRRRESSARVRRAAPSLATSPSPAR
jgi:Na+/H+ antiporter NhaA